MIDFCAYAWSLFASSLVSSTLLPGGSEAVLLFGIAEFPERFWLLILDATAGNTLGSLTTYVIGRFFPKPGKINAKTASLIQRFGPYSLLLAWLPIVGDGMCLAAGWLRLSLASSLFFIAAGKFLRYFFLAGAQTLFFGV